MSWNRFYQFVDGEGSKGAFKGALLCLHPQRIHQRSCPLNGIGQEKGNLNLPAFVLLLGFNKFRVQSERCHVNQVFLYELVASFAK